MNRAQRRAAGYKSDFQEVVAALRCHGLKKTRAERNKAKRSR